MSKLSCFERLWSVDRLVVLYRQNDGVICLFKSKYITCLKLFYMF